MVLVVAELSGVVAWLRSPYFVIPAALLAGGIGLYLLFRTFDDIREGRVKGRFDRLSEYRDLYDKGLMTETEYARICEQMGGRPPTKKPARPLPRTDESLGFTETDQLND